MAEHEPLSSNRFVCVLNPVQSFIRESCSTVPLRVEHYQLSSSSINYDWKGPEAKTFINDYLALICKLKPAEILQMSTEQKREWFYPNGYFGADADKRCRHQVRIQAAQGWPTALFSEQILSFGLGVLRPKYAVGFAAALHAMEGGDFKKAPADNIDSSSATKVEVIGQTFWEASPDGKGQYGSEIWEATNLIYGDVLGELEQLSSRRNERDLMDAVLIEINKLFDYFGPDGRSNGDHKNYIPVIRAHYDFNRLWDNPPQSVEELIERIDFILSGILIEE